MRRLLDGFFFVVGVVSFTLLFGRLGWAAATGRLGPSSPLERAADAQELYWPVLYALLGGTGCLLAMCGWMIWNGRESERLLRELRARGLARPARRKGEGDAQTNLTEEVAAASAAYLYNALPSIMREEPSQAYRRLAAHIEAAILAYRDGRAGWLMPTPSEN